MSETGPSSLDSDSQLVTVREAPHGLVGLDLRSLWEYRELLYFLTWRDVKVRYKQTLLGGLWAVLQPLLTMVIFAIFFGRLAAMPSDGAPYPLFAFVGLLPWTFFANAVLQAGSSLVGSQHLITKVYFPRLIIPISATLSGLLDVAISSLVLVVLLVAYGRAPGPQVLALPLFVALALLAALAVSLWLSVLNVRYRDVRYTLPFLTQAWMFVTPIVYPASLVPERWRTLYALNPMVGAVEGFRWSLLGTGAPPGLPTVASLLGTCVLLVTGALYFRNTERTIADIA